MAIRKSTNNKTDEIKFEVQADIGVINEKKNIRLRYVAWNGGNPKYDIRPWWKDDDGNENPSKGITLTGEELEKLYELIGKEMES